MTHIQNAPNINIGDIVEFNLEILDKTMPHIAFEAGYPRYTITVKESGIVVHKGNDEYLCISIKRYGGDYVMRKKKFIKKKDLPIEYKLSLISSFCSWWFQEHKNLYQEILIEAINNKSFL
jgi:hypothetical protein